MSFFTNFWRVIVLSIVRYAHEIIRLEADFHPIWLKSRHKEATFQIIKLRRCEQYLTNSTNGATILDTQRTKSFPSEQMAYSVHLSI